MDVLHLFRCLQQTRETPPALLAITRVACFTGDRL
jgi:hypothetical protein